MPFIKTFSILCPALRHAKPRSGIVSGHFPSFHKVYNSSLLLLMANVHSRDSSGQSRDSSGHAVPNQFSPANTHSRDSSEQSRDSSGHTVPNQFSLASTHSRDSSGQSRDSLGRAVPNQLSLANEYFGTPHPIWPL